MPPKKGEKTKASLNLDKLQSYVDMIKKAIQTLNLYTESICTLTDKIEWRIKIWCSYLYYILDYYEFVKLGRIMRNHLHVLAISKTETVYMEPTENFFWRYDCYLNRGNDYPTCIFWKGSLEYLNSR